MRPANRWQHKSPPVTHTHTFGYYYDFTVFAYMSLIYYDQTPPRLFTSKFWSAASNTIKCIVCERLYDQIHNSNGEWRAILNEVIICAQVIVLFRRDT